MPYKNKEDRNRAAMLRYKKNRDKMLVYQRTQNAKHKIKRGATAKLWRAANKPLIAERNAAWRAKNRDAILKKKRAYYEANTPIILARWKKYREDNPDQIKITGKKQYLKFKARLKSDPLAYAKHRAYMNKWKNNEYRIKKNEPAFCLRRRLQNRINKVVRLGGHTKAGPTLELTGCTAEALAKHLESQFLPGMTWENRGEWHIDHRKPCASFDLSDPVQQRACFHYTNLQPLWALDNLRKGASLPIAA